MRYWLLCMTILAITYAQYTLPETPRRCPEMCRDCAMSGFCYVCYDPYDGPYCEIKAEFRTSEEFCGFGCAECCIWDGVDRIECGKRTDGTEFVVPCRPPLEPIEAHDDHDAENYIRERPQGPMVALFMLFFLFVISVTIRENCRRRDRQNRLQDDAHVAPPMTQATHSPDASNPPSNINHTDGVVLVLGPSGEVEVGVTDPLEIKPLRHDGINSAPIGRT